MMKIPKGYYGYWKGLEKTELEPKLVFPDGLLGGQGISVILFLYLIVVKQNKTTQDKIITSQVQCGYFIGWRHHDEKQTFRIQSSGSVQLNGYGWLTPSPIPSHQQPPLNSASIISTILNTQMILTCSWAHSMYVWLFAVFLKLIESSCWLN